MISKKSSKIPPFIVMEVMEKAAEMERRGEHVIHLEVGEPDFDTPQCIKDAAIKAIGDGKTHYTHSLGLMELREAIAEYYRYRYKVTICPEQILVTSGTSPAMLLAFFALLESGDKVILSDPHYACYPNFITITDGIPHFIKVFEEDGFQYRPEAIAKGISKKTKAILINSPSNPTGNLLEPERMKEISALKPYIISDEIYHGLVYEGKEHSILEFTDRCFVINGFSKLYAMTGWRLGYIIVPKEFIRPLQKMHQNFFISANAFVQWAGVAALRYAQKDVERMRKTFDERRKFIIPRLRELGFGITVEPTGAFYVLANARKFSKDSFKFAFEILQEAKVGVTPGIDFGKNAEGYLRFSYANSLENIKEGMERIDSYIRRKFK
ncbi:MAG: pyridoxal phosphate-dependent aminotransferase [Deltaproteobacteria bacterium]|nr:pyridoxal phosphate-dependent aminotransferase [Deltaproteobacteria bacterium]MBW2653049.1 pyridoxal phosphate-dependent aminotransferase [Deltaproteobacteria bacterium]